MSLLRQIAEDVQAARERDPAARSTLEVLLCYSGLHAIVAHRINHCLWIGGFRLMARLNSQIAKFLTGVEIHPGARIGSRFFIDHGTGTVIGETAEIGDGCTLLQGVTLGGTGKETGKRHPTLCDEVTVGAHAQILGSITVGRGAVIGAAAVVVDPVPEYCTVVGQKAAVVRRKGKRVYDFRHDEIIRRAQEPLTRIEARLARLESRMGLADYRDEDDAPDPDEQNDDFDESTSEQALPETTESTGGYGPEAALEAQHRNPTKYEEQLLIEKWMRQRNRS